MKNDWKSLLWSCGSVRLCDCFRLPLQALLFIYWPFGHAFLVHNSLYQLEQISCYHFGDAVRK